MIPRRAFWVFDLAIIAIAFLSAGMLVPSLQAFLMEFRAFRGMLMDVGSLPPFSELLWIYIVMSPPTLVVGGALGNHLPIVHQSITRILCGAVLGPLSGLGVVSLAVFALKAPQWSRLFIFSFAAITTLGLLGYRLVLRSYWMHLRRQGHLRRNIVVVGSTGNVERIAKVFDQHMQQTEYRLFGYCDVDSEGNDLQPISGIEPLGPVGKLGDLLIHMPIHDVILVYSGNEGDFAAKAIRDCDYFNVNLRIVPEVLLRETPEFLTLLHHDEIMSLPSIAMVSRNWNSEALFFKRVFDIVASLILLACLSPVFLIIAIAIKLTTPKLHVFYPWRVVGRNGVEFTGYKFATMVLDADNLRDGLKDKNEMQGPVFKIKNDPRITPLGGFLRKYSLNELPQLWSVLKGDMSLVGPRPAFRHELERYEFWHKRKLSISPGVTCLWQVRGRNRISNFDDWVRMDLEYIDNWSLWLDFKILVWTVRAVVAGTGS